MRTVTLKGSHRSAPHGHTRGREVPRNKVIYTSLQTPTAASQREIDELLEAVQTNKRAPLTAKELEKVLGTKLTHLRANNKALRAAGLEPLERSEADRAHGIIPVKGTYAAYRRFLPGLVLHEYTDKSGNTVIGRVGDLKVASNLPISGFFGLDQRRHAETHYRIHRPGPVQPRTIPSGLSSHGLLKLQGWDVDEMAQFVRVTAYISLGGDNIKIVDDLKTQAAADGTKACQVVFFSTDGTPNGDYSDDSTVENTMDLQAEALPNPNGAVIAAMGANSSNGYAGAGEKLNVHKGVKIGGKMVKPNSWSSSWGLPSSRDAADDRQRWARIGTASQLAGIDGFAATGDNGPKDGTSNFTDDNPSGTPWLAGGAGVGINAASGTITDIHPWDDTDAGGGMTGYGISDMFAPLKEEARLNLPANAVTGKPGHSASLFSDLAAPDSGPTFPYNGSNIQVGGTSHSAPYQCGKVGYLKAKYVFKFLIALCLDIVLYIV
jgi:hypothetical protein